MTLTVYLDTSVYKMNNEILSDTEILQEANKVLLQNMSPAKVARFWAIWQKGEGDYLQWRENAFAHETVDSLFEQIKLFQETTSQ